MVVVQTLPYSVSSALVTPSLSKGAQDVARNAPQVGVRADSERPQTFPSGIEAAAECGDLVQIVPAFTE
jgi:hypothetical protein